MRLATVSILIPAYEYEDGIERILRHFSLKPNDGINIIISDDSESDKIKNIVLASLAYKSGKVKYMHNSPSLGAVKNWNSLIKNSESDYIYLLHQDECPVDINFYSKIRNIITENKNPDLIFLRCAHIRNQNTYSSYLISIILKPILYYFSQYIFIRNIIGSPSNIILKRIHAKDFDTNLQWLVDVEWFYSLLKKQPSIVFAKKMKILSVIDKSTSITSSIEKDLKQITKTEIQYIKRKHKNLKLLGIKNPITIYEYFLKIIEVIIWYFIRLLSLLLSAFFYKKLPNWW